MKTGQHSKVIKFEDIQKGDIVEYRHGGMIKPLKRTVTGRNRSNIQVKDKGYMTLLLFRHQILSVHRKNYQYQIVNEIIDEILTEEEQQKNLLQRIIQLDNRVTDIEKEKNKLSKEYAELTAYHKIGDNVQVKNKGTIHSHNYKIIAVTYELYRGVIYEGVFNEHLSMQWVKPRINRFSEKLTKEYNYYLR